jgi:hypothetical protein
VRWLAVHTKKPPHRILTYSNKTSRHARKCNSNNNIIIFSIPLFFNVKRHRRHKEILFDRPKPLKLSLFLFNAFKAYTAYKQQLCSATKASTLDLHSHAYYQSAPIYIFVGKLPLIIIYAVLIQIIYRNAIHLTVTRSLSYNKPSDYGRTKEDSLSFPMYINPSLIETLYTSERVWNGE